jgi:hypothetical protein
LRKPAWCARFRWMEMRSGSTPTWTGIIISYATPVGDWRTSATSNCPRRRQGCSQGAQILGYEIVFRSICESCADSGHRTK